MATSIARISTQSTDQLTFTNSLTGATASAHFSMATKAGGLLHCSSTGSGNPVTLVFYNRPEPAEMTAYALADKDNAAISLTIQPGRCYALPDELFAASMVQPLLTTNDTAVCRISTKT